MSELSRDILVKSPATLRVAYTKWISVSCSAVQTAVFSDVIVTFPRESRWIALMIARPRRKIHHFQSDSVGFQRRVFATKGG
jgi:hypothetical protein